MRTLFYLVILTTLFSGVCLSGYGQQFTFKRGSVTFKADTMEVEEAFKFMGKVLPVAYRSQTRYVIKDGVTYQKQYYLVNRILNRTYIIENGKKRRVKLAS